MDDEFQMLAAQMAARGGLSATELQEWIASVAQVQGNAELLEKAEQTAWVLFEQLGYTTRQTVRRCTIPETILSIMYNVMYRYSHLSLNSYFT